jgi:hypothetical protein
MTVVINEHLLKRKNIGEIKGLVRELSESVVRSIVQRNYEGLAIRVSTVERLKQEVESRIGSVSAEKEDLLELKGRLNQLTSMVDTFFKQDITTSKMESLNDIRHSYSILDIVRRGRDSRVEKETLQDKLAEQEGIELTEEELDGYLFALDRLSMIEVNEGSVSLTETGENLFSIYTANKKFTNKYERIKRKTQRQRRIKVDAELLEKVENIENGFNILNIMYNYSDEELEVEEIAGMINLEDEEVKAVLDRMTLLKLVEEMEADETNTFTITKYGIKIFTLYKESKRYTNKYEKIKRKERKLIEVSA